MPTQVQNLVLPPIQKIVPPAPKPPDDPAPRRGEEFGEALKTARKKSDDAKVEPKKDKSKETKTESKKGADGKPAAKTSSKSTSKAAKSVKPTKTAKSKTDKPEDGEIVDEAEDAETQDASAADTSAELATTEQSESPATPQTKPTVAKDDPDHPDQDKQQAAGADAAAAHLVQPIDRAKDQNSHRKNGDAQTDGDEDADPSTTAIKATTAAKPIDPSQQATASATPQSPTTDPAHSAAAETQPAHRRVVAALDPTDNSEIAPKPAITPVAKPLTSDDSQSAAELAAQLGQFADQPDAQPADSKAAKSAIDLEPIARAIIEPQTAPGTQTATASTAKAADAPPPPPEVQFAQSNHDKIVTGVQTQLLPHGGSMEIRLDPPELGALKVMVEMRDGVMSATFQTSNEEATQLLSHSLSQLKHVLETQGVSVERLQVQQAPKNESSGTKDDTQQQQRGQTDDHAARQEQQRKEMMRRMWRRVSGAGDPIDYLA